MLIYDFFDFRKFDEEKDWTKSGEPQDLLGLNSEVYTAKATVRKHLPTGLCRRLQNWGTSFFTQILTQNFFNTKIVNLC